MQTQGRASGPKPAPGETPEQTGIRLALVISEARQQLLAIRDQCHFWGPSKMRSELSELLRTLGGVP